ncbi:hypothetical protein BD626DRAFT_564957 [Schizophyllum amplum]|uniref:Uncharacterized protein n=1 Tax=Schizophyllum amplum TaxID=97359 RepID=A0A550CTH1_9AGAR|nr:hypothetical protein BD626DRAFT_564957 [Auriculariopsis ampla]
MHAAFDADDGEDKLLPITCRFLPYDQWLTTHLSPDWKVHQLKSYVLSKCLSNYDATELGAPPPDPHQGARPPSPITFAKQPHPHDRRRSVSPIQFARAKSPTADSGGEEKATKQVEDDGYQEDDEWDDQDVDEVVFVHRTQKPAAAKSKDSSKKKRLRPHHLTIIRFSTGQALEDDFNVSMYDFSPYELLEVHRSGFIVPLRRDALEDYCMPFWEGPVKVLKPMRDSDYEWRDKWLVAHDCALHICRSENDHEATHELPMSALVAVCTPDHLNLPSISWSSSGSEQRRIVCARFAMAAGDIGTLDITKRDKGKSLKKLRLSKSKDDGPIALGSSPLTLESGSGSPPGTGRARSSFLPANSSRLRPTLDITALSGEKPSSPTPPSQSIPSIMMAVAPDGNIRAKSRTATTTESHRRLLSDDDSGNHSSSESGLSSPVFAHTPLTERDEEMSDMEQPQLKGLDSKARLRELYKPKFGSVKLGGKLHDDYGERTPDSEASFPQARNDKRSKTPTQTHTTDSSQGQWVVFDLSNDDAYTSFLRVLHRWPAQNETYSINSTYIPWVASAPGFYQDDHEVNDGAPFTASVEHAATSGRPMASQYPEWRLWATARARDAGFGDSALLKVAMGIAAQTRMPDRMSEKKRGKQRERGASVAESFSWSTAEPLEGSESESEAEWPGWMGDIRRQASVRKRQALINHYREESGSTTSASATYNSDSMSSSAQMSVSSSSVYPSGTRSPRSHAWSTNSHKLPPRMGLPPAFQHARPQWAGQNLIPPDDLLSPSYAGRRPSLPNLPLPPPKNVSGRAASNPSALATTTMASATTTPIVSPIATAASSSSSRTLPGGAPLPRRASSAGILGFNGLKKKASVDQDARERDVRERERDQRDRQRRLERERGRPAEDRGHRSKLSLSSSTQPQPGVSRTRTMLRRAASGSNLREDAAHGELREVDAASQTSSKKGEGGSTKKKKMSRSEWIVKGLEDALDFVEGK